VLQGEAYDGDEEQRKQGYPRRYQLKSPAEGQPDPGGRWETPGRSFAQAFWEGGACEGRLGEESANLRAGRMQTLASMAGLGILKTDLNSGSYQPRQQFFPWSNNWSRLDLFHPDGNHQSVAVRIDRSSHPNVNRKNGAGPQLNDPVGRRTNTARFREPWPRTAIIIMSGCD